MLLVDCAKTRAGNVRQRHCSWTLKACMRKGIPDSLVPRRSAEEHGDSGCASVHQRKTTWQKAKSGRSVQAPMYRHREMEQNWDR